MIVMLACITASAENLNSVTIIYNTDEGVLQNAEFDLYRIGSISGSVVNPDSKFADYSVNFNIADSDAVSALAETIGAYALRDKIQPDHSDTTDDNGIADFDDIQLPDGAYLCIGTKHTQYGYIYFCKPTIILLKNGANVALEPKYEKTDTTTDIKVRYKVLKAWYTDEEILKPVEIEVQLLCDGEVYDTVTLNESNNWKFEWKGLSSHHAWTITEKFIPEGFVASLQKDSGVFLLSNINPDTETTTQPDETTTVPDETTSVPETTTKGEGLPQSGALSWPIPYLACIGVFLFIAGYAIYRKSEITDEQ